MKKITAEQKERLDELLGHKEISANLDLGLSGSTLVDHLIYVTENARNSQTDEILERGYRVLKEIYPDHFGERE